MGTRGGVVSGDTKRVKTSEREDEVALVEEFPLSDFAEKEKHIVSSDKTSPRRCDPIQKGVG
jgi:hypothetical protein